jgi:protein SPT2
MFKRKGPERVDLSDEDSDMEASGFEMAREEARAAKLARLEDEEEIRREEERIKEKKRRKIEVERKKIKSGK